MKLANCTTTKCLLLAVLFGIVTFSLIHSCTQYFIKCILSVHNTVNKEVLDPLGIWCS